jgi:hypothetical protein
LKDATPDVLLVSACDKLNNLQAIYLDLVESGLSVLIVSVREGMMCRGTTADYMKFSESEMSHQQWR